MQINPGRTRHGRRTDACGPGENAPGGNTWARQCETRGPLAAVPPAPSPISRFPARKASNFPTGKTTHAGRPPAPHPAFKSGRGVSSNLSPSRPRTPPSPPHPECETKGRARRVPPRGVHREAGPRRDHPSGQRRNPRGGRPWTKTPVRERGRRGRGCGKLWKKGGGLTMGGAERARIRGGCGPRGLAGQERERAARTVRCRRGRPRPPRGPPAPERFGARRGRTMAGAGRASWGLHRLRGAGARLRGRQAGLYQAWGTHRRRRSLWPNHCGEQGSAARTNSVRKGAWPGCTKIGLGEPREKGVWGGEYGNWKILWVARARRGGTERT